MRLINIKGLLKIISAILVIQSAFFLLCIPVALLYSESIMPFVWSILFNIVPGLLIFFVIPISIHEALSKREGYLAVTLAWAVLTVSGTLPYLMSGTIPDFISALFESTSGYTTTGSSILADVEILPKSILFWRSLTHWIGGLGIILLVIIILPSLKVGGYNLFSLESSVKQKILPKTKSVAVTFSMIYLAITAVMIVFLLAGGVNLFESICITFGTVATGGFTTRNSSISQYSDYVQYVVAIFSFLSAISFVVYYYILKHDFKKIKRNDELWFYLFFTTAGVVFVTLVLYFNTDRDFSTSFRHSFFQVIAQITTTGSATTDYMAWPPAGWFFMFLLLFAGGCAGSTTGGIKMARQLVFWKNIKSVFLKLQHPNAVHPIRLNGNLITDNVNHSIIFFIIIYLFIFIIGMMILMLSGISVDEAAGASVTAMSNVGPGLGASGNMGNFSAFNPVAKTTMILLMVIGRLEIFTILALFTKSFWRK
jgi:trk system potassium uptake protein